MRRSLAALVLAASLLAAGPAGATTASGNTAFVAVDSVATGHQGVMPYLDVEGVVDGDSAVSALRFNFAGGDESLVAVEACHKQALLSLNRPGRYRLELRWDSGLARYTGCKLVRQ